MNNVNNKGERNRNQERESQVLKDDALYFGVVVD